MISVIVYALHYDEICKTNLINQIMNKTFLFILTFAVAVACGKKQEKEENIYGPTTEEPATDASTYDPKRGEGKHDSVDLGTGLNVVMAKKGEEVSGVKCTSCHKMTDERLVGPGWKGVTERRKPEWILNFITNPDPMIDKDPEVQAQLEICLVRMPNQALADAEAREILEFMRQNDVVK